MSGETMKAGRELDALVAERVMGLKIGKLSPARYVRMGDTVHPSHLPAYSTDIAAAWEVVERMMSHGFTPTVVRVEESITGPFWRCYLAADAQQYTEYMGDAATAPLAICLAALATTEGSEPHVG